MLCAIPYGILADRYGRRRAIRLTIPGFLINAAITYSVLWFSDVFPPRALWLAAGSWLIGGGPTVMMAILWAMLADVTETSNRTIAFARIGVMSMAVGSLSRGASSGLMSLQPWIPMGVGSVILLSSLSLILLLRETCRPPSEKNKREVSYRPSPTLDEEPVSSETRPSSWLSRLSNYHTGARKIFSPYLFIFGKAKILVLIAFLVYEFATKSSSLSVLQFMSTRLAMPLARANLIISLQPLVSIPILALLLPYISSTLLRHLSLQLKDIYLARMSLVCLAIGELAIGLAQTTGFLIFAIMLQGTGAGYPLILRSLLTSFVTPRETARLYTAMELLQSTVGLAATVFGTNIFPMGLELGGFWEGLPWILSSILLMPPAAALWALRLPQDAGKDEEESDIDGERLL